MSKRALEIYKEIKLEETLVAFIKKDKSKFSDWYCGVTDNVPKRLQEHANEKKINIKLHTRVKCSSMKIAIAVEARMHAKRCLGKGSSAGGVTSDSKCVYVFKLK